MHSKKQHWHKIADSIAEINFSAEGLAEVVVANKPICIAQFDNRLLACTQKCLHAGGIMADGFLDVLGNIVCPLHSIPSTNPFLIFSIAGHNFAVTALLLHLFYGR